MNQDITHYAKTRYSAKAYMADKKISAENLEKVKELLRYSASSTNVQPWHFIIASSEESKAKIAKATQAYPFNTKAIEDSSHIVVFCAKTSIDEEFLLKVLEQEVKDGRYDAAPEFKDRMHQGRSWFVNMHKDEIKDLDHWMGKQVYLNAGSFLLGVSALGIDALPMEGIEFDILDEEFGLVEKGYTGVLVVPIGYADKEQDYNSRTPKSRLTYKEILTEV
ncbi:MAG TPA: oxygen-insensitive NAD(P)H nitroreductase [Alphaproteobacteria bacterium]|nr:oxygen-insensitive NAD(P)H nitroreductase [Alphaproteobacteria bacterium]